MLYTALKEMFYKDKYFAQVSALMTMISVTHLKLITDCD